MLQSRVFVGMVLILIFGEVLGLYGYVVLASLALTAPEDGLLTFLDSLLLSFSTPRARVKLVKRDQIS
jgi:hypothetical protein